MAKRILGHWKSDRHDNMVEYMKASDVSFALRQIAPMLTVFEESSVSDNVWTINITSTFKNHTYSFKLNEPFTDHTVDGKTMKTTFRIEGDKLVLTQEAIKSGEIPSTITREVTPDGELLITMTTIPTKVTCKRWFKPHNP